MKKLLFSSLLITFLAVFSQGAYAQLINTIAGTGTAAYSGDGGQAVLADLNSPIGITVDGSGNVYVADAGNNSIRYINASTGVITTIAGTGVAGYSGDGGQATAAELNTPAGVAVDASGNVYICDQLNERVRKITVATGVITTVAGNGTAGYVTDGVAATATEINRPYCVAFDASGNFYIADRSNDRVRKVNITTGIISTYAGSGTVGFTGDGGAATAANLNRPEFFLFDASGNLYIADNGNNRIREVVASTGVINTIAGTGGTTYAGDGSAPLSTGFNNIVGMAFDGSGNLCFCDGGNNAIRKIASGAVTTVAGTGAAGYNGECLAPTASKLNIPQGLSVGASGILYISDGSNNRIRKITDPCSGTPAAGTATASVTTGCPNFATVVSLTGASSGCYYSYQWESSTDGVTFTSISGATSTVYVPSLTNTTYFKCIVTCNVSGSSATSSTVMLTVNHPVVISPITGTANICPGSTSVVSDTATTGFWSATDTLVRVDPTTGILSASTTTGTDTIIYSATNVCGTVSDSFVVTINPTLTPAVTVTAFPGTSVCFGTSVTYTATPVNGGTAPTYQWYINSIFAGIGSSLTYTPSAGDSVSCILTSSVPCPTATTVANYVIMNVVGLLTPAVVVTDGILGDSVCRSTPVTFTAETTNGGATPAYQWSVNGTAVTGATSATYTYTPSNQDTLTCKLTSSFGCASPASVMDSIILTVDSSETPWVMIAANPGDTSCYGYNVTFTAYTRYGGTAPSFLWIENGINVATGRTYTYAPTNGDVIQCVLFSNAPCRTADSVFSNIDTMTINPIDTMSVSITAHPGTTIGIAQRDTIVATVFNGGMAPTYQWYLNGMPVVGATNSIYVSDTINDGDMIYCKVHGSNVCATPVILPSNTLTFHIITGVEAVGNNFSNVTLIPNPNAGSFTLQGAVSAGSGDAHIQITNVLGREVYSTTAQITNGGIRKQVMVDNQLANGIYLIRITTDNGSQLIRFTLDK